MADGNVRVLPRHRDTIIVTRWAGDTNVFVPVGADPAALTEITTPMYTERESVILKSQYDVCIDVDARDMDWQAVLGATRYCPCLVPPCQRHPEWDYTCSMHAGAGAA